MNHFIIVLSLVYVFTTGVTSFAAPSALTPRIVSSTHSDPNQWYPSREVSFSWDVPSEVTSIRTLYGESASSTPNKTYTPPIKNKTFTTDAEGVQYMHVQFGTDSEWGEVAHFRFMVDTVPPSALEVTFDYKDNVADTPTPIIFARASDALSGISHITIMVDDGTPVVYEINNAHKYTLPKASSGAHTATVIAYDKAGNNITRTFSYTVETTIVPTITTYTKRVSRYEQLTVSGTTYPNAQVEIMLVGKKNKGILKKIRSNEAGLFSYQLEERLHSGVYEMKARVTLSDGTISEFTPPHIVIVETVPFTQMGMMIINWISFALVIGVAFVLMVATLWYSFLQFSQFRRKVKRTMLEAENALKTNVAALRRDVEEFHTILVKAEKKRDLTKEEQTILKKFKKRLDTTEKEIEKKLEKIG